MKRNYTIAMLRIRAEASRIAWANFRVARALAQTDGSASRERGSDALCDSAYATYIRVNDYENRRIDAMVCSPQQ